MNRLLCSNANEWKNRLPFRESFLIQGYKVLIDKLKAKAIPNTASIAPMAHKCNPLPEFGKEAAQIFVSRANDHC